MKKMKVSANNGIEAAENSFFQQVFFRYWPYWPLFIIMLLLCVGAGFLYLRTTTPLYESTATLLIKDEKKGLDDSKIMESLNPLSSKKIVENETEIIRSRAILTEVVNELYLYAPIFEKTDLMTKSAYVSSPVSVELKYPDSLTERKHIDFTWSAADKSVTIEKNKYPVNTWVNTQWGICRFTENPYYHPSATPPGAFYFSLYNPENVATRISELLEVTPVSKLSTVIDLKIVDESPEKGEAILNTLMLVYSKVSIADKTQLATNTMNFVEKRLRLIEAELDSSEGRIQRYRTDKNVVDLGEQSQLYLRSVGESDQKASQLNVQLAALDEVEKYVESKSNQAGVVPASFMIQDPLLSELVTKLYDTEIQYERLRKTTGENNAVLVSLQNEINKIKPNIIEIVRNQRKSLQAGLDNINSSISRYSSLLKNVPKQEQELAEMKRPIGTKNNIYTFLLQKREEAALSYGSTVSDSRLVDKASSSEKPVSPKKAFVLVVSVLAGILLTVAVIMLKEVFNSKILFRSDVEGYTTLPVLGELVYKKSKNALVTGSGRSLIEEQFRQIRTSLSFLNNPASTKKIMITSSISGEGKSFVAANLALSMAATGRKVVLVDMDLYMPQIANIFNISNENGVGEYLNGKKDIDHIIKNSTVSDNLFVVPAGNSIDDNLSELLLNGKAQKLLDYLETVFDTVIIDTTPVLAITDAYTISSWCDVTLYVVRHGVTPKIHIQRLDDNAELHRLKNTGIVFNGVKKRGTGKYGFGYGYGYDYDYGYRYRQAKETNTSAVNA